MPGLQVVGIEFLIVEENDRQPALVIFLRVRRKFRGGEKRRGGETQPVQRILIGNAARDGEAQPGLRQIIAAKQFFRGFQQHFILVLQRDEKGLATSTKALEMQVEPKDFSPIAPHRREDPGGVEQAGVAQRYVGGGVFEKFVVEPDDEHILLSK